MKQPGRSGAKLTEASWAVYTLRGVTRRRGGVKKLLKALRPQELTYLCEICDELRELRICDDVFDEDYEEEDE